MDGDEMASLQDDLQKLSIGQLKKMLRDHGVAHQDCLEKSDLIARAIDSGAASADSAAAPSVASSAQPKSPEDSLQELQAAAAEVLTVRILIVLVTVF
jgi:hypothetical protein